MAERMIELPAALDLVAVRPLHQSLTSARGGDVTIDASAVERIGGLGLQLLVCAEVTWAHDGRRFSLRNPSPAFAEAVRLAGA